MSDEAAQPPARKPGHSRAFEALVHGLDDVVGLLAYATYKQSVRETALAGETLPDSAARSLTPAIVTALRSAAEQTLTKVVSDGIAQATPDIQNTATVALVNSSLSDTLGAIREARRGIEGHVTARTAFLSSFLTNLAAWVVTLLVAVAILHLASRPSVESTLVNSIGNPTPAQPSDDRPLPGDRTIKGKSE